MGEKLGRAAVQYGDLRGTVALDRPDQEDRLYELAGISSDEWFIVAYEIYGASATTGAYVWAVPRGRANYEYWQAQAAEGLETVRARRFGFDAEATDAAITLLTLNKRWSIKARWRAFEELNLDLERPDDD
jgi:hypothetical protein